jgi:hypothetical protein
VILIVKVNGEKQKNPFIRKNLQKCLGLEMHVKRVKKVIKGLKKASKLHAKQASSLSTLVKNKKFKNYGKKKKRS